jgi:hypothetical protein
MFFVIGGTVVSHTLTTDIEQMIILPRETSKDRYGISKCLCSFDELDTPSPYYNVMKDGWDVKAYRFEEFMFKYKNANKKFQSSVMSVITKTYNQLGSQNNMSIVEANFKRNETTGTREAIGIVYEPAFGNKIILPMAHENSKTANDNKNFIKYDLEFFVEDVKVQHFDQIYKDSFFYNRDYVKNVYKGTHHSYEQVSIEYPKTCSNCKQLNNYVLKLSDVAFKSNGDADNGNIQKIRTGVYGHLNNCMFSQNLNIIMKLNILY